MDAPRPRIDIPREKIAAFCRKWKVAELSLFGSVLRDDFRPDSDVDMIVALKSGPIEFEQFLAMKEELEKIFAREVDLLTKSSVERSPNPYRKADILNSAYPIYEAA
jgi:predicted nucleotidyltransferase